MVVPGRAGEDARVSFRGRPVAAEHEGPFERGRRAGLVAGLGQRDPEAVPGDQVFGRERYRAPVGEGREAPLLPQRASDSEVEPCIGVGGRERDGSGECPLGLHRLSQVREADPIVRPRARVGRLLPDNVPERALGYVVLPTQEVMNAQVESLAHGRIPANGGRE